jgi:hypothetical protein
MMCTQQSRYPFAFSLLSCELWFRELVLAEKRSLKKPLLAAEIPLDGNHGFICKELAPIQRSCYPSSSLLHSAFPSCLLCVARSVPIVLFVYRFARRAILPSLGVKQEQGHEQGHELCPSGLLNACKKPSLKHVRVCWCFHERTTSFYSNTAWPLCPLGSNLWASNARSFFLRHFLYAITALLAACTNCLYC